MTRLRRLAVVLAALAVVGTTVPTGGVTSVSAERGVSVDVVPDEEAFLGVTKHNQTVDPGLNGDQGNSTFRSQVTLLTVTNRFPSDLTVEVSVDDAGAPPPKVKSLEEDDRSFELPTGHADHVKANVVCGGGGGPTESDVFAVEIVASSPGVTVELTRQVRIGCEAPPDNSNGSSNGNGHSDLAAPALP